MGRIRGVARVNAACGAVAWGTGFSGSAIARAPGTASRSADTARSDRATRRRRTPCSFVTRVDGLSGSRKVFAREWVVWIPAVEIVTAQRIQPPTTLPAGRGTSVDEILGPAARSKITGKCRRALVRAGRCTTRAHRGTEHERYDGSLPASGSSTKPHRDKDLRKNDAGARFVTGHRQSRGTLPFGAGCARFGEISAEP
jgi:hypothetical protein